MNTAPTFSFQAVAAEKRESFNPIPGLTPVGLTQQIEQFKSGHLRPLAISMENIEERDDLLAAVIPKAKAAPTAHGWEIVCVDTKGDAQAKRAGEQKEVLEEFYNNLRATSAMDQDQLGGVELLLEHMMDAKGKRYSLHNIVWKSLGARRYTATFWHAPLWFFENKTGKLRFLKERNAIDGEDLEPGAWLTTVGRGLMIPTAIAWTFKRAPLRDWLIYCSRHGLPGFEGVTDADEGSKEWKKMVTAVRAAAAGEFAWVRSNSQTINKIDFGAEGELPFPGLIERMDRAMTAIWRGSDLGTMSADNKGASVQGDESDIMEVKDAQWLSGQLNMRVDRLVLDYVFGESEPQLAYFKVKTRQKQNVETDLKVDGFAMANGHPISRQQFAERYDRPLPGAEDELLAPVNAAPSVDPEADPTVTKAINEAGRGLKVFLGRARVLLGAAYATVMGPVVAEMRAALDGPDAEFAPALRAINERLPLRLMAAGVDAPTTQAFLKVFSAAFFNGVAEESTK